MWQARPARSSPPAPDEPSDNARLMKVDNVFPPAAPLATLFGMVLYRARDCVVSPALFLWRRCGVCATPLPPRAALKELPLYGVRDEADHRQQELFLLVPAASGWLREGGFTFEEIHISLFIPGSRERILSHSCPRAICLNDHGGGRWTSVS